MLLKNKIKMIDPLSLTSILLEPCFNGQKLGTAKGATKTQTTKQKKRPEFQAFLDEVMKEVSLDQHVHVILDNYCTHKRNDDWLAKHSNVTFHFTPTSAS
jgi:hypothetical protein